MPIYSVPGLISIHAPREGSDALALHDVVGFVISIHAPREGSDGNEQSLKKQLAISIHAPREGSDGKFGGGVKEWLHFYPRSPRAERPLSG